MNDPLNATPTTPTTATTDSHALEIELGGASANDAFFQVRGRLNLVIYAEVAMAVLLHAGQHYDPPAAGRETKGAFGGRLACHGGPASRVYMWDGSPILKIRWTPGGLGRLAIDSERLYQHPPSTVTQDIGVAPTD
jgi:hypothetical protein